MEYFSIDRLLPALIELSPDGVKYERYWIAKQEEIPLGWHVKTTGILSTDILISVPFDKVNFIPPAMDL